MSLTYRTITDDESYCPEVFASEQNGPRWFRESSAIWTADMDSFLRLWRSCEVVGLFDQDDLVAAVWLEPIGEKAVNIHVSVTGKVSPKELARFFISLKRKKVYDGIEVMVGWLLAQNRGLRKVAAEAGFYPTGLSMKYGSSNGRVLRWMQVRA